MIRDDHVDAVTLSAFTSAVVIGGANFVAVKETVDELDPLYGAAARFGLAGAVFLAIVAIGRAQLPHGAALVGAVVYGALGFGGAYALLYIALVELSAGVASVLMATAPLFTLALAVILRMEKFTARGLVGGALAVAGIAVLSARSLDGKIALGYLLAALAAPLVVAGSTIAAKRFPRTDPIATNAVGMTVGAALLAILSLGAGESWTVPKQGSTWAATAWLVLAGSVGFFWCILFVVKRWTASVSTYVLPLMPVVAVALGALLLGEAIGPEEGAGALLVIAGAYVAVLRQGRTGADAPPAAAPARAP